MALTDKFDMDRVMDSVLQDIDKMIDKNKRPNCVYGRSATVPFDNSRSKYPYLLHDDMNSICGISPTSSVTPNPPSSISCNYFQPTATVYKWPKNGKVEMKDHVFISKDATYRLAQHLIRENWGRDSGLLC